jgi:exodeoxyribonuclease X
MEMGLFSARLEDVVFRVVDVETTGLDAASDGICEIAWRDMLVNGEECTLAPQVTFINPGMHIPPSASAVHHIIDEDVVDAPSLDQVLPRLLASTEADGGVAFVAHNAEFEAAFLRDAGPWLCTYRLALHLWPELSSHSLQFLRYALGLNPGISRSEPVHRAGADVAVTLPLLARALDKVPEKWPRVKTVGDLIDAIESPALLHRIPFQSSNFMPFEAAEISFLEWIIDRDAGGRDCVHTAHYWLDKRMDESRRLQPCDGDDLPF